MIFVSFADASRQLFTGISVFPSLQLKVSIQNPFLKCISVWSKTLDPSSVFLQLLRSKRLSSMMKTLLPFSQQISLFTISAARREVKRGQFVTKQRNRRNTFFFQPITSGEKLSNMMFGKKSLNTVN